jgi:hypothetical protein
MSLLVVNLFGAETPAKVAHPSWVYPFPHMLILCCPLGTLVFSTSHIAKPQNERRPPKTRARQIRTKPILRHSLTRTNRSLIKSRELKTGQRKTSPGWSVTLSRSRLSPKSCSRIIGISSPTICSGCRHALPRQIPGAAILN